MVETIKSGNTEKSLRTESRSESVFGFLLFSAVTIIAINVSVPLGSFGIVFGKFLSQLADETTATSLANGIFNTVMSLTGLVANVLLDKWSCRNVGLLGALFTCIGSFSLIFVRDLTLFMIFFGVFEGFGYGLIFPASLTALNNFFDKKVSLMLSISQAVMVACTMGMPPTANYIMRTWSYSGAVFWMATMSVLNIPSAIFLSSFRSTYAKVPVQIQNNNEKDDALNPDKSEKALQIHERRCSSFSVYRKISQIHEDPIVPSSMSYSLLKDFKYINMTMGLSLAFTSDICFITIIPLILSSYGAGHTVIALSMSIFFGFDLISRILLSVVSAFTNIKSRSLFFWGSFLSMMFRIAFICHASLTWKMVILAILGFLRCLVQTPLPLVISEQYPSQFATAFSLYMVICGIVSMVCGLLISFIKYLTDSDLIVYHLLTGFYAANVILWLCETITSLKSKKDTNETKV